MSFEVIATGPLAIFVDAGRQGFASVGVSASGAADRSAYQLGQRLLGQGYHAAALEVTFGGLVLRATALAWVALTGADAQATLDGRPVGHGAAFVIAPGQELRLGLPERGLRTYVSVRGGFGAEPVLGSRSTDVLSGLGPPAVQPGEVLTIGPVPAELDFTPVDFAAPPSTSATPAVLDVIRGPRDDWFADPAGLVEARWEVTAESNRVGVRLSGPVLDRHQDHTGELPSEPMVRGSIQVPPSGQPLVFLADHPVTGGYPVIGVLTPASADLMAQARPGDGVRFRWFPRGSAHSPGATA
ncbi:biotin-dependent carboxyltransferase family protein [Ammonicoccus fulvus]|uniref:Biotin-dependent carboxyltransferase family protein n=1 Tax=Ammonicoccus fulvus TaxID=3138240 RepID=A0ABZ3FSC2_9ACTN